MSSIFKQSSWLFLSQSAARVIGFVYTIFLARSLGPNQFGLFSAAVAFFALLSVFGEFGFNRFLTREIARDRENSATYLANVTVFRITLTLVLFIGVACYLYLFDPDQIRANLTILALLAIFPVALAQTVDACFVAIQKLQYSAIALLFTSIFTTLLGFLLVSLDFGPTGPVLALIFGQVIYFLILFAMLRSQKLKVFSKIQFSTIKKALVGSLPYGILGVLGMLYFRIDTVLLSYLRGNFETGIYSAAYKFLETAVLVPSSISLAIFPVMVKLHETDHLSLKKLYRKVILITFSLGVIGALVYFYILPVLILWLLPSYNSSSEVIQILALTIPFMFVQVTASQVLLTSDKNLKALMLITFVLLAFNLILNLIFIPQFGFLAAAWVTVISDIFAALLVLSYLELSFFRPKDDKPLAYKK